MLKQINSISAHVLTKEIFEQMYLCKTPLLIKNATNDWLAHKKWSYEYFQKHYGSQYMRVRKVAPVTGKILERVSIQLEKYLLYIQNPQKTQSDQKFLYYADMILNESNIALKKDFAVPEYLNYDYLDNLPKSITFDRTWIFFGYPAVSTPIHKDSLSTCAWLAMIKGQKEIRLFNGDHRFDASNEDMSLYDKDTLCKLKNNGYDIYTLTLTPGDILYIPALWYHHVKNIDHNIMITKNFLSKPHVLDYLDELASKYEKPLQKIKDIKNSIVRNKTL